MEQLAESNSRFTSFKQRFFTSPKVKLHELSITSKKTYFTLCLIMAMPGYLFLFGFPVMLISLSGSIYESAQKATTTEELVYFSLQLTLFVFAVIISAALFKLKFRPPQGPKLSADEYPQLFEMLDELKQYHRSPFLRINRVVLCDSFEIKIVKTPKMGFPVLFTNTLLIGLPVLQTMSPDYFRALITREFGQASLGHHFFSGWLASLALVWKQYIRAAHKSGFIALPVYWFFKFYARFYQTVACEVIKTDTLQAEYYALDIVNDEEFVDVITYEVIIRDFINKTYWRKIRKVAMRAGGPEVQPHARMSNVVRELTQRDDFNKLIVKYWKQSDELQSPYPAFIDRIHNVGHHKPGLPGALRETAAEYFLGSKLATVVDVLDKKWRLNFNKIVNRRSSNPRAIPKSINSVLSDTDSSPE